MHFGNGQAATPRKDGASSPPALGLRICPLFLLCAGLWLLGLGSGAAGLCQPCPGNCTCASSLPYPAAASCLVNCSAQGLLEAGSAPENATILDLSSNNITTLDKGLFEPLHDLQEIDLSDNPWLCDCRLSWLPLWVEEHGVTVLQLNDTLCDQPPDISGQPLLNASFARSSCGADFISCPHDASNGNESVLVFTPITLAHPSNESCSALCFAELYTHGALDAKHGCLCGKALIGSTLSPCRDACDTPSLNSSCGPTLLQDIFSSEFSLTVHHAKQTYSLGEAVELEVRTPIPIASLSWNLGDRIVNGAMNMTHRYAEPGLYDITVTLVAGSRNATAHDVVLVVGIPEELQVLCPSLVRTHESLNVSVSMRGGSCVEVGYKVVSERGASVSPECPPGSLVFPENSRCYQLISDKAGWFDAQRICKERGNGDLVIVSGAKLQDFLKGHIISGLEVWIGFNDSSSDEALDLKNCQNHLPGEPEPSQADRCVRMGPTGVCNIDLCSAKHSYVCEYKPSVIRLSAQYFVVGFPFSDTKWPLQNLTRTETESAPNGRVEVLVFTGLQFMQEAYLSSLEVVTRDLKMPVQMRFQLFARKDEQNEATEKPTSTPVRLADNETLLDCDEDIDWSNCTNSSLAEASGWYPSNESMSSTPISPVSSQSHHSLVLLSQSIFIIQPGSPTHYSAFFEDVKILIHPDHLIIIQHDYPNEGFLHGSCLIPCCEVLHQSDWMSSIPGNLLKVDLSYRTTSRGLGDNDTEICEFDFIRVVGTTEETSPLFTQSTNFGLKKPGQYTVMGHFSNQLFEAGRSCNISVVSPISGLSVIHPPPQDGIFYIPTNNTMLILKILSGTNATAYWIGGNQSWSFQRTCPPTISALTQKCAEGEDVWFSEVRLSGLDKGVVEVLISVRNDVNWQNITVPVKMEEPIRGLAANPLPQERVILNTVVNYVASVEAGSDVVFKWVVDDKLSFTYYDAVFNVLYRNADVYKLTLEASNHVSNATLNYKVTAEKMVPMRELDLGTSFPSVGMQGSILELSSSILVDSAVEATYSWSFGDGNGTNQEYHYQPPYNKSFPVPDPKFSQVFIQSNVTHTYKEPGTYNITVSVYNKYENMSITIPLQIQNLLSNISIVTYPEVLVLGSPSIFEAKVEPSDFGVSYTWDFGDGSGPLRVNETSVNHTFYNLGIYNVSLTAGNDLSEINCTRVFGVHENITGLMVSSDEPTERGLQTFINASVETGDNITWTFNMGDGIVHTTKEPMVNYTYSKDGNYTVTVTASNPVSMASMSLLVRVYVLQVLKIEPSSCILENSNVTLTAYVTGDCERYTFNWTFGNGSSIISVYGVPSVEYNFSTSGIYPLSLVLSSQGNKAYYFTNICVEPEVVNVTLLLDSQYLILGKEAHFKVIVFPTFNYRYTWDFGTNGSKISSVTEDSTYTFKFPGMYLVSVSVFNNVSSNSDTAFVYVQEPVGTVTVGYNATLLNVLELDQVYIFNATGNGTNVTYSWDFGDGSLQTGQTTTQVYNSTGNFPITLYCENKVSKSIVNLNITVKTRIHGLSMNATRTVVPLNGSVTFSAFLLAGDDVGYSWILCDRCSPIFCNSTISYTFRSIGTFNVIVTAMNDINSLQDSIIIYVLQVIEGLQIVTSDLVNDCCFPTNKSLPLQATVTDGSNISYSWFILKNDSVVLIGSGKTYQFTSMEADTYTIILKATNMLGSMNVSRTITFIEHLGLLSLVAHPNPVAVNTTVNISMSLSSGSGVTYTWYLEDKAVWFTYKSYVLYTFLTPNPKEVFAVANNTLGLVNSTITVFVQEPIEDVAITTNDHKSDHVPTGTIMCLIGSIQRGSNVSWSWKLPEGTKEGKMQIVHFYQAGVFSIGLNASNNVSWEATSLNITVQDKIEGLTLQVSKMVVEPGERVTFTIVLSAGTSVTYNLTINGEFYIQLNSTTYTHEFTKIGGYPVTVVASNNVSEKCSTVMITVLEAIKNLNIINCCEMAIPARIEKSFIADVSNGSLVAYTWQFDLQGQPTSSQAGKNVTYSPVAAGLLKIHLSASNDLGSENITKIIKVQEIIVGLTLEPVNAYVNRSVTFNVFVRPSPSEVIFRWMFGDSSPIVVTHYTSAEHSYHEPGDYLVVVNASNLISFWIAQISVATRVLQCEEPVVQLALPSQVIMRRSQRNYIEAQINLRGCTSYQTVHRWTIYKASSCLRYQASPIVCLQNVDASRPQLVIPKLALDIGDYCFEFSVSFGNTPLSRSSLANVTMAPCKLVPIIDGGSYRVWSNSRDLVLDGKKSYDPNLEENEQTRLDYKWTCTQGSESNGFCSDFAPECGIVTIPKSVLEAGAEFTFYLSISKTGRPPESTNQTVLIKKGSVPIVSLKCVSCKAQSVYEVSASSYVYLEGSCSNCLDDSRSWRWTAQSFHNKSLTLDLSTTTTGHREMNLVLRQGALMDGEGYKFTLHARDPTMDEEGFATIDLLPNSPPSGGSCRIFPNKTIQALSTKIQFHCTGWTDAEDEGASLVFSLKVKRCKDMHCDEFWVYKGSRSEHSTFLPVGFHESNFNVSISVLVQDQQGATAEALNHTQVIAMPIIPAGFHTLSNWLRNLTETTLQGLVRQGDPQHVAEYSLALITVLNEHESLMREQGRTIDPDLGNVRRNITDTLIELKVNTVDDIRQITAALAQCTVTSKEPVGEDCQMNTLKKLEGMMTILQDETTQGMMTPTTIADNILNIMGDVIYLVNTKSDVSVEEKQCNNTNSSDVASKAYNLSSDLMRILMKSRVLNEEPLTLQGGEILAWGKRSDPFNLLCYSNKTNCQFFIPQSFNSTFSDQTDIIQVMFQVDSNPYPFGFISNYTVSTKVASMAFQTSNGSQIIVESLDSEKAITVSVANNTGVGNITAGVTSVDSRRSVKVVVKTDSSNLSAGLHLQVTYAVNDATYIGSEPEPYITVYLHESGHPDQYNYTDKKLIRQDAMSSDDHKLYTFFISPTTHHHLLSASEGNLTRNYYLNITNHFTWSSVDVTLGLYTSLCQYFDENESKWKTDGLEPLEDTRPDQAVCLTKHLTAFGASLFVPRHSVSFIHPPSPPGLNYIVLLTCAVCFVTYCIATIIVHKLDLLDVNKAGVIPFCGKSGFYKYEVLVKTGWGRGSGTTAHVGISLYGVDNKSGHRHLDGDNTFHRNSVDIFQIATERSLGNVWKIRLWHDNKGLSPSWYVQHVVIRDFQSNKTFFFLVNDWLSVGQEDSGRRVEREIFAASEAELKRFSRIFMAELQRGVSEKHVWLSMWDRPPRSRFTRVQRATCCALLIFLFLCANSVWYGIVRDANHGNGAVSNYLPFNGDSVAAGMVTSVLVYPVYLVILYLFRRARSKTCVKQSLSFFDQQSMEIDNYLDTVMMESSFITYTGTHGEAFSDQTRTGIPLDDTKSFIQWNSNEGVLSWPDLLSDPSIMGNTIQKLERHRACRHIGIDGSSHPSEEDSVVVGLPQTAARPFVVSDGASSMSLPRERPRISRTETDLLSDLSNPFGDKTETIMLEKLNEKGQALTSPARDVTRSAKSPRPVITDAFQRRRQMLPSWCARVAHALSCVVLLACFAVSVWIGVGFTSSVGLMWLISGIFSFLCSFFILEPLKVLAEGLYFALIVKRLHPEEEDTLVECPLVEKVSERVTKVRPPQGFALFQAREEARKVKLLHRMLKHLVVYMLFFLVILLTNYGESSRNPGAYLLQRAVKQELGVQRFLQIKRSDEFWDWTSDVLLPYLHSNQLLQESYSHVLGSARLRQIRLRKAPCDDAASFISRTCLGPQRIDDASYDVGWIQAAINQPSDWTHSLPDVPGDWFWGSLHMYDNAGYNQTLRGSLEDNEAIVGNLRQHHWIDNLTRALFVEFSLYSPGVNLYSSVTLLLEFPVAGRALSSAEIRAFPLLHLSSDTHLLLTMMVFLMMFVVYFVLSECLAIRKEGRPYFTRFWNYVQWLLTTLAISTVVVYLSRASLAEQQWNRYLKDKTTFVGLHQVAFLGNTFHGLSASLLFILTLKAAQQLRFIREWSVFGKTLSVSAKELCAASGAVLGLLLMYAQLGFLLFSSSWENFHGFGSSIVTLFSMARGCVSLKAPFSSFNLVQRLFSTSFYVLEMWILVRLFAAVLINNYSHVRLELFRPAFELQDYEMVELFLRRLRIWMGVSKVKEFRHKVRFEGMEPLPSRSSSDSKSIRLPTPSAASDTSSSSSFSTISSQLDPFSAGSTREKMEADSTIQRLLPVLDNLLSQFDLVNHATEEVYRIECSLEDVQAKVTRRKSAQARPSRGHPTPKSVFRRQDPSGTQSRKSKESVPKSSVQVVRPPVALKPLAESSLASKVISVEKVMGDEPALVPMQIAQHKKKKSMRAHNRVHPSVS